jgi:hypothetical protein
LPIQLPPARLPHAKSRSPAYSNTRAMSASESSSSDEEFIAELTVLLATVTAADSRGLLESNEFQLVSQICVDVNAVGRDYLATVQTTPYLFQTVTKFMAADFEDF